VSFIGTVSFRRDSGEMGGDGGGGRVQAEGVGGFGRRKWFLAEEALRQPALSELLLPFLLRGPNGRLALEADA
jgi:hypothetical protein